MFLDVVVFCLFVGCVVSMGVCLCVVAFVVYAFCCCCFVSVYSDCVVSLFMLFYRECYILCVFRDCVVFVV